MEPIELPHLSVGSPAQIALSRVSQMGMGTRFEAARRVEMPGQFVGERLVLNKPVVAGCPDGPLVEAHRVKLATFDARDLRSHEGLTVLEILRPVLRPNVELLVLSCQSLEMLQFPIGRCKI